MDEDDYLTAVKSMIKRDLSALLVYDDSQQERRLKTVSIIFRPEVSFVHSIEEGSEANDHHKFEKSMVVVRNDLKIKVVVLLRLFLLPSQSIAFQQNN